MFLYKLLDKCWLHVTGDNIDEPITLFTNESLKLCKEKQLIRLGTISKSKYKDIVLPNAADGIVGYHKSCYKYFKAVKGKPYIEPQRGKHFAFLCNLNYHNDFHVTPIQIQAKHFILQHLINIQRTTISQAVITQQMVIQQNQSVNISWVYVVDDLFKSKATFSQFILK